MTLVAPPSTSAASTPAPATAKTPLRTLYDAHSKHSSYQLVHPSLMPLLGDPQGLPKGKNEVQRQRAMENLARFDDRRVLDIGANTGYFSFAALAQGAKQVVAQEGNARHAEFIATAGAQLGAGERLQVRSGYYDFNQPREEVFDICLCLNVLHHLGDDFGDPQLSLQQARQQMLAGLNGLARHARCVFLQIGFNWKGQVGQSLFDGGQKAALVEFVCDGVSKHWRVDEILVASGFGGSYEPLNGRNVARDDSLGEFLNRPLFQLSSLVL